jgi:hypothetical protein
VARDVKADLGISVLANLIAAFAVSYSLAHWDEFEPFLKDDRTNRLLANVTPEIMSEVLGMLAVGSMSANALRNRLISGEN